MHCTPSSGIAESERRELDGRTRPDGRGSDRLKVVRTLAIFVCAAALYGQARSPLPPPIGLETKWEIAPVFQELSGHAEKLLPLLEKIDVQSWVEKGASDTYVMQLQSSKEQARALAIQAKDVAASPERLAASLQVLLRIQGLDSMLASLGEGIRKYQGAADAQALASAAAQDGAARERLQRYVVNLAAEREQDLAVMDREAQRCRGILTQAPPNSTRKR
jgi:hypothetical protein